nr:EAL domain-containing protein [Sphingopyxis sp.]
MVLDDFGTGYSSCSYFRQFPLDKVKIDPSFIAEMLENTHARSIVKAVISGGAWICRSLPRVWRPSASAGHKVFRFDIWSAVFQAGTLCVDGRRTGEERPHLEPGRHFAEPDFHALRR